MSCLPEFSSQPVQNARAKMAAGDTLNATDISNLWFIAGLCPDKAGKFVFDAQTILQLLSDTTILFPACDSNASNFLANRMSGSSQLRKHNTYKDKASKLFVLYPNPTNSCIRISSQIEGSFSLSDIFGHKVFSFEAVQNTQELDLSKLVAGIYIAKLQPSHGKALTQRLVISH